LLRQHLEHPIHQRLKDLSLLEENQQQYLAHEIGEDNLKDIEDKIRAYRQFHSLQ
jgi:hypothetical protein